MKPPLQYNRYKKRVLKAFYRTELRQGEKTINNQSPVIGKELGVPTPTVDHIIAKEMKRKIKELNERINANRKPEDLEVEYDIIKPDSPIINKTSKYVGVYWYKDYEKWRARIKINGKQKHLGYFTNEFKAHLAYEDALEEINFNKQPIYFSP